MSDAQDTSLWKNGAEEVQLITDSDPSASGISDDLSPELLHTSNSSFPKKRKVQGEKVYRTRLKRLKMSYNDDYRDLFNNTVNEIVKGPPVNEADLLPMSQIGVTQWSSCEKEIFFTMLARRGRHNLSSIASAIGTKSELEVHVYLQLLQKSTAEHHLNAPRHQLLGTHEIPGAFEVSQDCSATLELNADALSILQQKEEEKQERRNYDKLWLLDKHAVRLMSQRQRSAEGDKTEVLDALAPSELLNLKSFLKLSTRVFMNSSQEEDNWRSYCEKKETPSILHTAFSDFHRLVISITKRLIQSSLFIAMSRIRATTSSNYRQKKAVRLRDVSAALNVLGMKHNSQSFWIEVARRCNLAVYDIVKGPYSMDEELNYDEVEKRLARRSEDDGESVKYGPKPNEITPTLETAPLSLEIDHDEFPSDSISNSSFDPAGSSDNGGSPLPSSQDEGRSHDQNTAEVGDFYAEALDMRSSQREESQLWKLLGQDPPVNMKPEEIELPMRPKPERKTADDLDDWSSWVFYAPEWEVHENPIPISSFAVRRCRGSTESRTRLYGGTSTGSGGSESEGIEDDHEESSSIAPMNFFHDDKHDDESDDEEEASTSDFEGEESLDEIKSEIFEQRRGPDNTSAHYVSSGDDSVEGTDM